MYFNDIGVWVISGWKSVNQSMTAYAYEVHPGTRIPIDQPLPSSEPPAKSVREFSHHTNFRFVGDKCEASVNGGVWQPVNETIEDMAAMGAKEAVREPPEPEPSASYVDAKLGVVAELASGLLSRVENIEAELHAMSDRMRDADKQSVEQWNYLRFMCDGFSGRITKLEDAKPEPIHIQVASLIAVNQKLEADLRIVRKERDGLQVRCNDLENRANEYRLCCERLKLRSDERLIDRIESLLGESDELRARVDSKPEAADDPYPRTYRLSGNWYVTFESQGVTARCYEFNGDAGGYWVESEMAQHRAVRCPDPRAK